MAWNGNIPIPVPKPNVAGMNAGTSAGAIFGNVGSSIPTAISGDTQWGFSSVLDSLFNKAAGIYAKVLDYDLAELQIAKNTDLQTRQIAYEYEQQAAINAANQQAMQQAQGGALTPATTLLIAAAIIGVAFIARR